MDYNTKSFLERLGLAKNEMKLYLAALELGETTATELAKKAKVHRVAAYSVIDNLVKKGLLTQTQAKRGRLVSARHPKQIESLLRNERRSLRRLSERYELVLPELTSLFDHASVRPRVQFFEGIKGLEQINTDVIETLKELPEGERITHSYSNPTDIMDRFEGYVFDEGGYIDSRKTYGIRNKVIALDGEGTREITKNNEEDLREMIALPKELFPFENDITIYADKIALMAFQKEFVGVIIESREIVQDQLAIFKLAWEGAKVLSKKYD